MSTYYSEIDSGEDIDKAVRNANIMLDTGPADPNTPGNLGQFYLNTTTGILFQYDDGWEEFTTSGGGHVILNADNVALAQQPNLKFVNAAITNDDVNNVTVITTHGEQGPEGSEGPEGPKGPPGDEGPQGKNLEFNWNGVQLGVRVEGDTTYQYVDLKGPKGDKGDKGDKGEKGDKGDQGEQGEKGDKGDKGEQGIQGLKGDKGDTGLKGDKPAHRWVTTSLQVENPDGTWGDAVNLKGESGEGSGNMHTSTYDTTGKNTDIFNYVDTGLSGKVDNARVLTDVPLNAKFTDTVYTHPANHAPSIITQDANNRFVTDTEKSTWNGKADGTHTHDDRYYTETEVNTLLDSKVDDSQVLTNVPANAKFTDTVTTINEKTGAIAKSDITALGIPAQDTVYTHPSTHSISEVSGLQDALDGKQASLGFTPLNANLKGAVNGVAELDEAGKVPASQLPSYVDDVLEYDNQAGFPTTGETGKIYVAKDTNKTYRWSGSGYVEISASLALGTTSSTAFRGDYGQTAYTHSQESHAPTDAQKNSDITKAEIEAKLTDTITTHSHTVTKEDVGLGNVTNESKATMFTSPTFTGSTPTTEGNLMYHEGNITISTSAPASALPEGHQHQVYE